MLQEAAAEARKQQEGWEGERNALEAKHKQLEQALHDAASQAAAQASHLEKVQAEAETLESLLGETRERLAGHEGREKAAEASVAAMVENVEA